MKLEVGKKYKTKLGNIVQILSTVEADDENGAPIEIYSASVVKVINGHENVLHKVWSFTGEGKWLNEERRLVKNCIHDLSEEYKRS